MSTNAQERAAAQVRFFELLIETKSSDLKWSLLLGRLKELRQEYFDTTLENDPDALAARRREAVAHVLQAVALYLGASGCPEEDLVPLDHLVWALLDLESGAQNPLLSPPKRAGGRPRSSQLGNLQLVYASAAITLFMREFGLTKEKAAREIATVYSGLNLALPASQIGRNRPVWKQLTDWRDKLLAGKGHRWEFLKFFYDALVDKPDSKLAPVLEVFKLIMDQGGHVPPRDTTD